MYAVPAPCLNTPGAQVRLAPTDIAL